MFHRQLLQFSKNIEKKLRLLEIEDINESLDEVNLYLSKKDKIYFYCQFLEQYIHTMYGCDDYLRINQLIQECLYPYKAQYQSMIIDIKDQSHHKTTIEIPRFIVSDECVHLIQEACHLLLPYRYRLYHKDDCYVDSINYEYLSDDQYKEANYSLLDFSDINIEFILEIGYNTYHIKIIKINTYQEPFVLSNSKIIGGDNLTQTQYYKYLYQEEYNKYKEQSHE